MLDGFLRYDKVSEMYRQNHPQWQRQAFVESTSFATGVAAAGAIAPMVMFMTPGGLLLAALAGGSAAVGFDHIARGAAGKLFDRNFL